MKFTSNRPYGDPEKAARKLIEIANSVEAVQDCRILIELINWPFLHDLKGSPAEYKAASSWRSRAAGSFCMNPDSCEIHPGRRGAVRLMTPLRRPGGAVSTRQA
jgi:hypothetical protein